VRREHGVARQSQQRKQCAHVFDVFPSSIGLVQVKVDHGDEDERGQARITSQDVGSG
jgi:hypothetical protein